MKVTKKRKKPKIHYKGIFKLVAHILEIPIPDDIVVVNANCPQCGGQTERFYSVQKGRGKPSKGKPGDGMLCKACVKHV